LDTQKIFLHQGRRPKLLLVEDQPLTLLGIHMSLQELDRFEIVGEATNGVDAVAMQKKLRADVVLMDVSMPQMDGIEASWQIKHEFPETKIIIFTSFKSGDVVSAALGAGAEAFLTKDRSVEQIALTIDTVLKGYMWIDPLVADSVVREHHQQTQAGPVQFSTRELEVLKLIRDGLNFQQIAAKLNTSDDAISALMKGLVDNFSYSARVDSRQSIAAESIAAESIAAKSISAESKAAESVAAEANEAEFIGAESIAAESSEGERVKAAYKSPPLLTPAMAIPAAGYLFEDKYLMQSLIGQGAGGFVVRAEHIYMKREVAIKVLHHSLLDDRKAMRDFRKEAMSIACLNHDGIISIYDFGLSANHQPYLVMEYFPGTTLRDLLENEQRLALPRFCDIFSKICNAMQFAHDHNIIHCDIKPANILIKESDQGIRIKLADFGLAKAITTDAKLNLESTGSIFVTGTPSFMSPEQCRGQEVTPLSDIYSLGCVMAEALTGEKLFIGNTAMEIMSQHISTAPPTLSQLCPSLVVPPELELMIFTMLQKDPESRIKTIAEVGALIASLTPTKV
jgi:DNA-binding NarL/FixJ family response regulator/tRNA A-37 threonylcarbamoyl transferase component Bud32